MGKCLFMRKGETHTVPSAGLLLSSLAEGSIVKLNENGSPVEFYVAKHDYESALNGAGRTLLVRKDCYDTRQWHSSNSNYYASSTIDKWLNGTYASLLDADVKAALGTSKFYYNDYGNGSSSVTTLQRSVFLLSVTELGLTSSYANTEGSALPVSDSLKVAYHAGSKVNQWTRTPHRSSTSHAFYVNTSGAVAYSNLTYSYGSRPCFTLPANTLFDEETLEFKGVA